MHILGAEARRDWVATTERNGGQLTIDELAADLIIKYDRPRLTFPNILLKPLHQIAPKMAEILIPQDKLLFAPLVDSKRPVQTVEVVMGKLKEELTEALLNSAVHTDGMTCYTMAKENDPRESDDEMHQGRRYKRVIYDDTLRDEVRADVETFVAKLQTYVDQRLAKGAALPPR